MGECMCEGTFVVSVWVGGVCVCVGCVHPPPLTHLLVVPPLNCPPGFEQVDLEAQVGAETGRGQRREGKEGEVGTEEKRA